MGETEEFNTLTFEKKLMQLKDTQESIQGLSSWCLKQRANHKKIVQSWLNVLKRVKVEQRLVLFYLANDVIQYSKRKNYEFVDSWGLNLQKATPLVREEKVRQKIMRIFKIWEQRNVYDEDFLSDLTGLLSAGAVKKTDDESIDFQPQQLVNKIKQCTVLETDTDLKLKCIHECPLDMNDTDVLCTNLKDRSNKDDVEKELNEGISCVEKYTQALQREIVAREALLALLSSASQYYSTQRGEVKVVAYAYKNFGARVRALKRKLDDLVESLPNAAPSPPRRDEDVPSPAPDDDLDLPNLSDADELAYNIDRTFNTSLAPDGSLFNMGLSSFLSSDNPMSLFNDTADLNSANKIEVINNRPSDKPDFNINDFLNTLSKDTNASTPDNNSVASGTISQKSQDTLPGLDLLTPESTGNPPPPTSFYGTAITDTIFDEPDPPYVPDSTVKSTWNANTWSLPPAPVPPPLFMETPESPPPAPPAIPTYPRQQELPAADVDHRGSLPPPPPPPVLPLLSQDVDHRLLPALAPPAPPRGGLPQQDVDHRNLISLTHQLQGPRPSNNTVDQDYRVPPMVPPPDIVESVDMELSEDEEQPGMYPNQPPNAPNRRNSFNNNKVLVGGDNGKIPPENHTKPPHSAPILPMTNPFDTMPDNLKFNMADSVKFNMADNQKFNMAESHNFNMADSPKFNMADQKPFFDDQEDNYDEDLRSRGLEERFEDSERWDPRNQRFPRNWTPRTNFRPQFWPRNGPRPPRWNGPMGPRPQRFW